MAIGDLTSLPDPLQNAIQQNTLARQFLDALKTKRAYTMMAEEMPIDSHIGATLTLNQMSEMAVDLSLNDPSEMDDIDNGMEDDDVYNEQYGFTLGKLARTTTINLLEQKAHIVDYALNKIARQGRQALRIREGRTRVELTQKYHGGSTVVTGLVSDGSTACTVDNVIGFQQIFSPNNKMENVSDSNGFRLPVIDRNDQTITLMVTGVDVDTTNVSSAAAVGGKSGTLHYVALTGDKPVVGHVLVSSFASPKIRPNGKASTQAMNLSDVMTMAMVRSGKTILANQGVDPDDRGFYTMVCTDSTIEQLCSDPEFLIAFQGAQKAPELLYGKIVRFAGVEFVSTTEAPIQAPSGTGAAQVKVNVARPILLGKRAVLRGRWKGLAEWVEERQRARNTIHDMQMLDGIAWSFRSPVDRLGERCNSSYQMIEDHCAPSDAQTAGAPQTAGQHYFKRAVQYEHAVAAALAS